jgi:hypothetical protein
MSREEEYRRQAEQADQLADSAVDPEIKRQFREIANGWRELAAQVERGWPRSDRGSERDALSTGDSTSPTPAWTRGRDKRSSRAGALEPALGGGLYEACVLLLTGP